MGGRGAARWALWAATLGLLCAIAAWRVDPAGAIRTNILTLLPDRHDSQALDKAVARSREAFSRQLLALVTGPDDARTRKAAMAARKALLDAGLQAADTGSKVDAALALYRKHGFALLAPAQSARFEREGAKALATDMAVALASPAGMVSLGHDPGGYVGRFVASLPRPYPDFLPDGPLMSASRDGRRVFLLRLSAGEAFGTRDSERAARAVAAADAVVAQACSECRFRATGAALFSDAARHEAKFETTWLTIVSTLLIMLLIAWVYRSLAPHVLGFLQLFASVAAGGAAVIAVFGSINILTLVFGTTLLGIAIDYAFLYFSEYWFGTSAPAAVMRKIRAGLVVGLATGVLAFAFLALTGFPALTQIALFSVAGLLEAALVVVLIFPITLTRAPTVPEHAAVRWPARFMARAGRASRWRWLLPLLALLAAVPGWFQLKASDDVRELSHFPPRLMQVDRQIRQTLARFPASGFYLTEAPDLAQALSRESALFARLGRRLPEADPLGLSRFVPAPARQQASLAAWHHVLDDPRALRDALAGIGLPPGLAGHVQRGWQDAPRQPLAAGALLEAVPDLGRFVIPTDHGVALVATVFGARDLDNGALAAAADGLQGVAFVQPLARMADTFAGIRVRATWLVVIGYLLISALLVWRYGWRGGVRMIVPPLVALGITLGAMGWLGEPVNVFVVVALILILGLGRDYAVFLREVGARERSPALAVTLSATTTLLSFGLLSLSRIPALHAFGLATLIGILASYLLAPLSLPPTRPDGES